MIVSNGFVWTHQFEARAQGPAKLRFCDNNRDASLRDFGIDKRNRNAARKAPRFLAYDRQPADYTICCWVLVISGRSGRRDGDERNSCIFVWTGCYEHSRTAHLKNPATTARGAATPQR